MHEFDKVELFAYCTPAQADDAHADILRRAEGIAAGARADLSRARSLRGGPRHGVGVHDRPRGVQPRRRSLARGVVGELVSRLPGPSRQRSLPHERRVDGARAHGQRLGPRRGRGSGRRS